MSFEKKLQLDLNFEETKYMFNLIPNSYIDCYPNYYLKSKESGKLFVGKRKIYSGPCDPSVSVFENKDIKYDSSDDFDNRVAIPFTPILEYNDKFDMFRAQIIISKEHIESFGVTRQKYLMYKSSTFRVENISDERVFEIVQKKDYEVLTEWFIEYTFPHLESKIIRVMILRYFDDNSNIKIKFEAILKTENLDTNREDFDKICNLLYKYYNSQIGTNKKLGSFKSPIMTYNMIQPLIDPNYLPCYLDNENITPFEVKFYQGLDLKSYLDIPEIGFNKDFDPFLKSIGINLLAHKMVAEKFVKSDDPIFIDYFAHDNFIVCRPNCMRCKKNYRKYESRL